MKTPIASAVLILAIGAMVACHEERQLAFARNHRQILSAEAARLGITSDSARPSDRSRVNQRTRSTKQADAHQVAADFIAFDREMESIYKKGLQPDDAMRERNLEIMDRTVSLDAAQMTIVVAEIRACEDLKEVRRQLTIGFCISALATSNPQAALTIFDEFRDFFKGGMDRRFIFPPLSGWAQSDPAAALEWFRKNGGEYPGLLAESARQALVCGAAAHDPKLAFQLLGELGLEDTAGPISAIFDVPQTPAERTEYFSAFRDYLASVTDEKSRQEVTKNVYSGLTHDVVAEGEASAMKWLDEAKLNPAELASFALKLGDTLGYIEGDVNRGRWIEWAGANVPSDKRNQLVHEMVYYWTCDDFQATGEWLNGVADGPVKHAAIRTYAATISPYQPEAAAQWAVTLPPGQGRQKILEQIHRNWPQPDRAAKAAAAAFAIKHGIQ